MIGFRPSRAMVETSMPLIWKAPSPTSTNGRRLGFASCAPMLAGHRKPEREVVPWRQEFSSAVGNEVKPAEERIADVGDDYGVVLERQLSRSNSLLTVIFCPFVVTNGTTGRGCESRGGSGA